MAESVFQQVEHESRRIGFLSVTVDPEGFRSGNLNRDLGNSATVGEAVVMLEKTRRRLES
jgi:PP-loop superfamily ATP-utilizing enzyme